MRVESGQVQNVNVSNIVKRKADEEKRLREMTIPKKQKRLYDKIKFTQKKKRQEVRTFIRRTCHRSRLVQLVGREIETQACGLRQERQTRFEHREEKANEVVLRRRSIDRLCCSIVVICFAINGSMKIKIHEIVSSCSTGQTTERKCMVALLRTPSAECPCDE